MTINHNALRVSVLNISRGLSPVEHGDWRIDSAVKFSSLNAVHKACAISGCSFVWPQSLQLSQHFFCHYIIRIEREHPRRLDLSLAQSELPLITVTIKHALNDTHIGKRRGDFECLVVAETVDHNDVPRPTEVLEGAANVWRFVVREYERRDLL